MSLSPVNILLLANVLIALFFGHEEKKRSILIPFFSLASLIVFGVIAYQFGTPKDHTLWPAFALGAAYSMSASFNAIIRRSSSAMSAFWGIAPVLLVSASDFLALTLYLLALEVFAILSLQKKRPEAEKYLANYQAGQLRRILLLCAVGPLAFLGAKGPLSTNLYDYASNVNLGLLALSATLIILSLDYMGVFASAKSYCRHDKKAIKEEDIFRRLALQAVAPVLLLEQSQIILEQAEYLTFLQAQRALVVCLGAAALLVIYRSNLLPGWRLGLPRIYLLLLAALFMFDKAFSSSDLLTAALLVESLPLLGFLKTKASWAPFAKRVWVFITLPTPFSPAIWLVALSCASYEGPQRLWLYGFCAFVVGAAILAFNRRKDDLLSLKGEKYALPWASFAPLTIMTIFVSTLFVAKI